MVVSAPMDEIELRNLMYTAQLEKNNVPFSIDIRGEEEYLPTGKNLCEIEIGKGKADKRWK